MTRQDEASAVHDGHLEIPRDERPETLVRAADFVISAGSVAVLLLYFDEGLVSDLQTITTLLWPGLSSQYSPGSPTHSTTQQWLPWLGTSARRS